MPAESWPCGATTTTTSGRIPHWAIGVQQKRAGRLSNLRLRARRACPTRNRPLSTPRTLVMNEGRTGGRSADMQRLDACKQEISAFIAANAVSADVISAYPEIAWA